MRVTTLKILKVHLKIKLREVRRDPKREERRELNQRNSEIYPLEIKLTIKEEEALILSRNIDRRGGMRILNIELKALAMGKLMAQEAGIEVKMDFLKLFNPVARIVLLLQKVNLQKDPKQEYIQEISSMKNKGQFQRLKRQECRIH